MAKLSLQFDPVAFLEKIDSGKKKSKIRKGQTLFAQGDPADAVFYLARGKVELRVVARSGKEAVLAMLAGGSFFGEGCLAGQPLRIATVVAMTEVVVVRVEKAAMINVLHTEPVFSELFVTYLLTRNVRIEADLVDHIFNSSEKRLARMLIILSNFGKESEPESVIPDISQDTLASMIGTTRSRVSFFMNRFRKLGFIEYNGHLRVHPALLSVILRD